MSYAQAERLSQILSESGVEFIPQPRGFGKKRGVPDSVVWIRPEAIAVNRVIPILVELEGQLFNVDDFEKFARRTTADEPYQHHIELPMVDGEAAPLSTTLPYDIFAFGGQLLTDNAELTEQQFHDAIRNWFEEYGDTFETDARITVRGKTRLVWWSVVFTILGHTFKTQVPFVVDAGPNLHEILRLQASRIVIPSIAVLNDENRREQAGVKHFETDIRFTRFASAQLSG